MTFARDQSLEMEERKSSLGLPDVTSGPVVSDSLPLGCTLRWL